MMPAPAARISESWITPPTSTFFRHVKMPVDTYPPPIASNRPAPRAKPMATSRARTGLDSSPRAPRLSRNNRMAGHKQSKAATSIARLKTRVKSAR
jgi:hypothetical protein